MILIMLFACGEHPVSTTGTPVERQGQEEVVGDTADTSSGTDTGAETTDASEEDPCESLPDLGLGLSLFDLPVGGEIIITAVDSDGVVMYSETLVADTCGVATPFQNVAAEDFGDTFDGWDHGVYAMVKDSGYDIFQGLLLEEGAPECPVSTQWTWDDSVGDFVPLEDPDLGVMIGNFMVP